MQTPPDQPATQRGGGIRPFSRPDILGLTVLLAVLAITDVLFVLHVKDVGSKHSGPVVLTWVLVVGVLCFLGGLFQAARARPWWEIVIIGAGAGALVGFVVVVLANPTAGSQDCPGSGPCDTSFGAGAIFLGVLLTPVFAGFGAAGRGIGHVIARRGRHI